MTVERTIKPCWNSTWKRVKCLESDNAYGFFKNEMIKDQVRADGWRKMRVKSQSK